MSTDLQSGKSPGPADSTPALCRFPKRQQRQGIALVMVLAFVVLLTGLVVAYFARTMTDRQLSNSSFNQAAADQLASSALAIITSNLKQELANSGTASTIGSTTIYTNSEVIPVRNGISPVNGAFQPSTLLRVSSTSAITGTVGIEIQASNAPSTGTSANGRTVSMARWNQHYLLPRLNASSNALDTTPAPGSFTAPDWIYVTGTGGPAVPALTSATASVVGRYAYAIYDEGALLDVNSAGYPCIASGTSAPYVTSGTCAAAYSGKGALAFADLTVPGLSGTASVTGSGLSAATVNGLVGWRNYATLGATGNIGTFPGFTGLSANSAAQYYSAITSNTTGFMTVSGSTTSGGLTDQAFLNRQQLISLMTQGLANTGGTSLATLQNALQYLGTFSRAVTGPSWSPEADADKLPSAAGNAYGPNLPPAYGNNTGVGTSGTSRNGNFAYNDIAETPGSINRDLANIRFPNGGSITHYNDAGIPSNYAVNEGDPYLQHRFSLARINWITHTGPAAGMSQAVNDCFGLQWGADAYGNPCWMYIHGTIPNQTTANTGGGTAKANQILTLDKVAALGREPDFFELLKAAILNGSLGRSPGPDFHHYNMTNGDLQGAGGTFFDLISDLPDQQIIQIGVNIIDQYHIDSYPTAVFFQGNNSDDITVPQNGPLNVFYGIKNLPYLNKILPIYWDIAAVNGFNDSNGFNAWMQPELWDPFQATTATTNRPTSFSLRAYGSVQLTIPMTNPQSGPVLYSMPIPQWDYDSSTPPGGYSTEAVLYFKDSPITSGTYISAFANPLLLSATNQDVSVATTPAINIGPAPGKAVSQSPYNVKYTQANTANGYVQFMGIHAGYTPYAVVPYNGKPWTGPYTTGTEGDRSHTWVADNNSSLVKSGTTTTLVNYGNFIPTLLPTYKTKGVTFCLKYWDGQQWLPYSYMSRVVEGNGTPIYPDNTMKQDDPIWGSWSVINEPFMHTDPLTDRFSGSTLDGSHYHWNAWNVTWQWQGPPPVGALSSGAQENVGEYDAPWLAPGPGPFYYDFLGYQNFAQSKNGVPESSNGTWSNAGGSIGLFYGTWAQNIPIAYNKKLGGNDAYYADPDGIVRPGNDCAWNVNNAATWTASMTDGLSQLPAGYSVTTGSGSAASHTMGRRPLVLNRPFRSVGELGYAYRDLPFKTLDFFTAYSADAALLDVFSVTDQPAVVSGQINPNNAPAPVLNAVLSGAAKQEALATSATPYNMAPGRTSETGSIAELISEFNTAAPGSFSSRADLVTKLGLQFDAGPILESNTSSIILQGFSASSNAKADQTDKTYLEAPIRALADVTNTRTWNLMIDVIAQTGSFVPNAPAGTGALNSSFVVQGERRYWLHVAIDRFTGKVVDEQLEPVYE